MSHFVGRIGRNAVIGHRRAVVGACMADYASLIRPTWFRRRLVLEGISGCGDQALVNAAIAGYPGEETLAKIAPMFPRFAIRRSH